MAFTPVWHGSHSSVAWPSLQCGMAFTPVWHGLHSSVAGLSLQCGMALAQVWQGWVDSVLGTLVAELDGVWPPLRPPALPPASPPPHPWATISPLLLAEPAEHLPTPPSHAAAAALYGDVARTHAGGHPFASYSVRVSDEGAAPTDDAVSAAAASVFCHSSVSFTDPTFNRTARLYSGSGAPGILQQLGVGRRRGACGLGGASHELRRRRVLGASDGRRGQ